MYVPIHPTTTHWKRKATDATGRSSYVSVFLFFFFVRDQLHTQIHHKVVPFYVKSTRKLVNVPLYPMEYTSEDIFEELATVRDPERLHQTLADLNVVHPDRCSVEYVSSSLPTASGSLIVEDSPTLTSSCSPWQVSKRRAKPVALVHVVLRPTVPHCHLMHLICLSVMARLQDALPVTTVWKIRITLVPGSHLHLEEVERQAQDKERVAAALENPQIVKELQKLINPYGD